MAGGGDPLQLAAIVLLVGVVVYQKNQLDGVGDQVCFGWGFQVRGIYAHE